jgi:uncharacterized protein YcnI
VRIATVAAVTSVVLALGAPALAHPGFDPNEVPAGREVDAVLVIAHGCGSEEGGSPTVEVVAQMPEAVVEVTAEDGDGWDAEVSDTDPIEVSWTATDGGVDGRFELPPLTLLLEGRRGDTVYAKVFQGCEEGEYRWIGTPDEPADDPAVSLTITRTGRAPAPSPTTAEPTTEPTSETTEPTSEPSPSPTATATPTPTVTATPPPTDDGGGTGWWWVAALLAVAGGAGIAISRRS